MSYTPFRRAYRLALLVCILAIAYLAFAPLAHPVGSSFDIHNHFLAFLVLAWLAERSFPQRDLEAARWGFLLGFGLMIEVVQGFLPYRDFSLLDFVSDVSGIVFHDVMARMWRRARKPVRGFD